MTRIEWPGFRFWLIVIAGMALSFWFLVGNQPAKADGRYQQVLACQIAILMKLPDPDKAELPVYLNNPDAFTRGENNALETIETFEFRAPDDAGNMERHGAYCAYDERGQLAAADVEY